MREAEGLASHLVVLMGYKVVDQTTQVTSEHTRILLSDDDLLVAAQHFLCVLRQRVDESEVGMSDLVALLTNLMGSFVEVPVGTTPADDQRIGILIAFDLEERDLIRDVVDLLLTGLDHEGVVSSVGADSTGREVLFKTTETVLKPGVPGTAQ